MTSMPKPRAVLFDLDGVLIDSYRLWFHLLNQTALELGYPGISQELYRDSWGQSTGADRDRFFPGHSLAEVERFYRAHYFEHLEHLVVDGGVKEVFERLREDGIATAVVTNTQKSLATLVVDRTGAAPNAVVGGGDAPRGKPAPDLLLHACELLSVAPEEAWMVGDSVFDREAARRAGILFVGIRIDGDRRLEGLSELLDMLVPG